MFKIVFILQIISTIYLEKYELKTELIYANDTWGAYNTVTQKWNGAIALVSGLVFFVLLKGSVHEK